MAAMQRISSDTLAAQALQKVTCVVTDQPGAGVIVKAGKLGVPVRVITRRMATDGPTMLHLLEQETPILFCLQVTCVSYRNRWFAPITT